MDKNIDLSSRDDSGITKMSVCGAGDFPDSILSKLRDGDESAFREVYLAYHDALLGFLRKLTGSEDDSRDILQGVFIKLWEKRADIDPARGVKSLLYTFSRNSALNYLRDNKRIQRIPDEYELNIDGGDITDQHVIAKETKLLIQIAVDNMPQARQEVFKLFQEGESYEEIALKLNISQQNARKHVMTARRDIREMITFILLFLAH